MKKLLFTLTLSLTFYFAQSQSIFPTMQEEGSAKEAVEAVSLIYLYQENPKHSEMITVYISETYPEGLIHYWATWHENTTQCTVLSEEDDSIHLKINYSWGSSDEVTLAIVESEGELPVAFTMNDGHGGSKRFELINMP